MYSLGPWGGVGWGEQAGGGVGGGGGVGSCFSSALKNNVGCHYGASTPRVSMHSLGPWPGKEGSALAGLLVKQQEHEVGLPQTNNSAVLHVTACQ